MRTVLAVAAIGLTSVGYFLGPAAAKPIDCYQALVSCEGQLTQAGYSKTVTQNVCLSRQQACWAENARNGYGINGEKKEANSAPKGKKPKKEKEWKRPLPHVASPSKSGIIGSNGQFDIKTSTPTTAASTATNSVSNPTAQPKTSPPKPATVSTEAIARERGRVGAGRF